MESVGDFFFGVEIGEGAGFPCIAAVVGFGEGSAGTDDVSVGGGVKVDGEDGVCEGDGDLLPLLAGCGGGGGGREDGGGQGEGGGGCGCGGCGEEGSTVFAAHVESCGGGDGGGGGGGHEGVAAGEGGEEGGDCELHGGAVEVEDDSSTFIMEVVRLMTKIPWWMTQAVSVGQ